MSLRTIKVVLLSLVLLLLLVGGGGYYFLFLSYDQPVLGEFTLDIERIRQLANQHSGPKPQSISAENVATGKARNALMLAGGSWSEEFMGFYSFQLVYADHQGIIDTAVDEKMSKLMAMKTEMNPQSYDRMVTSLNNAEFILFTHEHPDHTGGLIAHPDLANTIKRTYITQEQMTGEVIEGKTFEELVSAEIANNAHTLNYDQSTAFAPGIVLIKAPGHSVGTQMIFVQLENDREYLFIGDIAWHSKGVEMVRPKPRFITDLMLGRTGRRW